jgi:predicted lipoprotein with Yx(FWY)xxD motif
MNTISIRTTLLAAALAAALVLAACGGDDGETSGDATAASTPGGNATVEAQTIGDAGEVLVDAEGNALYSPQQEASGTIRCTGECEAIWMPLTVSGSSKPTAGSGVTGTLGTVKRPDGGEQVTYDGAPLYTFSEDGGPGTVTGDGLTDSFAGMTFDWHVATPSGAASSGGSTGQGTSTGASGGYGY